MHFFRQTPQEMHFTDDLFIVATYVCINFTLSRVGGVMLLAWNLKGPKIESIFLRDSILI